MKFVVVGVVVSLAAMFLYPLVLSVGKDIARKMKSIAEEKSDG